ncbi:GntR family transcriptional regulator [Micromonospora rifamycinica]|uniref:GntR family transcriptional regulator n=1 Tax=Micromonospora rifamycinica TaxID=291594 RepID=UPI0033C14752
MPTNARPGPKASPRIAAELQIPDGTPVYERRRRTVSEAGPVDLVSTFVPVDIAVGADITKPDPIPGGLLDLVARHKGLRADYATERLSARRVSGAEAAALEVPTDQPMLSIVITVHRPPSTGRPATRSWHQCWSARSGRCHGRRVSRQGRRLRPGAAHTVRCGLGRTGRCRPVALGRCRA